MVTTEDGCANLARTDILRLLFRKTEKNSLDLENFSYISERTISANANSGLLGFLVA
jgi:hypothetical protein